MSLPVTSHGPQTGRSIREEKKAKQEVDEERRSRLAGRSHLLTKTLLMKKKRARQGRGSEGKPLRQERRASLSLAAGGGRRLHANVPTLTRSSSKLCYCLNYHDLLYRNNRYRTGITCCTTSSFTSPSFSSSFSLRSEHNKS